MSGSTQETCQHPGCRQLQIASDYNYKGTGQTKYRRYCQKHYDERKAFNNGGFATITEYNNSLHPYRQHRKDYCENIDGRLSKHLPKKQRWKCTSTVVWDGMLDVDHKDGDPLNNDPKNLQTLCKCCHAYKTNQEKDYASIGRTKLRELGYTVR